MRIALPLLMSLILIACAPRYNPAAGSGAVAGSVMTAEGLPAGQAFVFAYRSSRGSTRGPADFGIRVEDDGRYLLEIPPGSYLLVARQHRNGATSGPPRPGGSWAFFSGNPVAVQTGRTIEANFTLSQGTQTLRIKAGSLLEGSTGFSGQLVDSQGQAIPGAFALAYRDRDFHRMPDFTSLPADENGHFTLFVPEGGLYCLAARTKTRGQPVAGEPYGLLGGGPGPCRSVPTGTMIDIGPITLRPYRR